MAAAWLLPSPRACRGRSVAGDSSPFVVVGGGGSKTSRSSSEVAGLHRVVGWVASCVLRRPNLGGWQPDVVGCRPNLDVTCGSKLHVRQLGGDGHVVQSHDRWPYEAVADGHRLVASGRKAGWFLKAHLCLSSIGRVVANDDSMVGRRARSQAGGSGERHQGKRTTRMEAVG